MYIYSSRAYLLPDHNSISFESLRRVATQYDSRSFCGFCHHSFPFSTCSGCYCDPVQWYGGALWLARK